MSSFLNIKIYTYGLYAKKNYYTYIKYATRCWNCSFFARTILINYYNMYKAVFYKQILFQVKKIIIMYEILYLFHVL